jgi:predicted transcriptional regulator/GNAT superfamily N-acetyltransferase
MSEEGYPDRIISNNEIGSLEILLRSQCLNYPNYEKWISGTINQVRSGNKIAFGFFTKSKEIVGDGILRITASDTVELKNFFLQKNCRGRGYGPLLLEYIENYCIERGYTQIHVDMPIKERDTIRFFIGNHYDFQARGDFYGQGNESYLLVKKLQIKYIGNYDWIKISKWVMDRIFGYNFVEKVDDKSFIYYKIINNVELFATAIIIDDLDTEIDEDSLKLFIKSSHFKGNLICLAPYFNDLAVEYANNKGITLIDRNKLEKLSGYTLPTSSKDIAGLIVVIKPEYFKQLVDNKDRVFIKGGGTPAGVNKNQVILFYITSPTQAIGGYAIITKVTQDHPLEIWKKYSRQSAFADEDYKTYTEGKSIVTAYSFEDINKLENYISIIKLRKILGSFNHQAGQRISTEELGIIKDNF